jgi:FkbM family methyltransferase
MQNLLINSLQKDGFIGTIKKVPSEIRDRSRVLYNQLLFWFRQQKATNGFLIKEIQGSLMQLDINDVGISKELILTGIHEKNSTLQYKKTIKPGMHIGDFGANIGYYSLITANILKDSGHIYAFEPSPKNYEQLKKNIELNKQEALFSTFNSGLGAESSQLEFYISSKGNMSSFIKREEYGDIKIKEVLKVDVVKADDFFMDKPLDFVRMDVEGFEVEIIAGMHQILSRVNRPKALFIEVHSELLHKRETTAKEFISLLCNYGYEIDLALYRGRTDICAHSLQELLSHTKLENGYWETFFKSVEKK